MPTLDEHKADLAKKLTDAAASAPAAPPGQARGFLGGINIWSILAGHLIDAIKAIVDEAIAARDKDREKRP